MNRANKTFLIFFLFFAFFLPSRIFAVDGVEINTATIQQLDALIGVGPAIGQKIIDTRPFSSVDDLLRVKGIGEKTLQKIKDQGLAYVEGQPQQVIQPTTPSNEETISAPTPPLSPTPTPPLTPNPTMVYQTGIILNEILPSPEGADEQNEWIVTTTTQNRSVCS